MTDKLTYDARMLTKRDRRKHQSLMSLFRMLRFVAIASTILGVSIYGAKLFEIEFKDCLAVGGWLGLSWLLSKGPT